MNLTRRLNQVLQMRARQEVPQRNKFTMVLILHVDHAPAVLATPDVFSVHDDGIFRADDGERDEIFDAAVQGTLFFVLLFVVVGVHAQIVEEELFLDALLEGHAFFESEGVGLSDYGDNVDDIRELFENNNVYGLESKKI